MNERLARAVDGWRVPPPDPDFEIELSRSLRSNYDLTELSELYRRFELLDSPFDQLMRRVIWRAGARKFGHGIQVGQGARYAQLESIEIGDRVFIGALVHLRGRLLGQIQIGNHVWIGPDSTFDVPYLTIGDYVSLGTGTRVLAGELAHDLHDAAVAEKRPSVPSVVIERGVDIGRSAVILPGVTIGADAIVKADSVVADDVAPRSIVSGAPAAFCGYREDLQATVSRVEQEVQQILRASPLDDSRWESI